MRASASVRVARSVPSVPSRLMSMRRRWSAQARRKGSAGSVWHQSGSMMAQSSRHVVDVLELGRDRGAVAAHLHHGAAPLEDAVAVLVQKGVAQREPRDALVGGVRTGEGARRRGRGQQPGHASRAPSPPASPPSAQRRAARWESCRGAGRRPRKAGAGGGVRRRRRVRKAEVRRGQPVGRAGLEVELAVEAEQRRAVVVAALDVVVGVREARVHVLLSVGAVEDHSDVLTAFVATRRVNSLAVHGERLVQALREDAHGRFDRVPLHDAVEAHEQLLRCAGAPKPAKAIV